MLLSDNFFPEAIIKNVLNTSVEFPEVWLVDYTELNMYSNVV